MKKFYCIVLCGLLALGCERIEPGYAGIKVSLYGDEKGVNVTPLPVGRVWYNPWTADIYQFPTFMQTKQWSAESQQPITFNSSEGNQIVADVSFSYAIEASKVPTLFSEFRQPIEGLTNGYIRNQVRDAFSRAASKMKIMDIIGEQKQTFQDNAAVELRRVLQPKGIIVDSLSIVGQIQVDEKIRIAIDATIATAQQAKQAENMILQMKAEAQQKVETARGEAESITVKAEAQAKANKILAESITPELVWYNMSKTWDGKTPATVLVGSGINTMLPLAPGATQ